jgi:Hydantoinase/oxoprolinase N-terminal region/Hydantoinase/oxoprolinase
VGLRIGVDIGGTFTDAVSIDERGRIRSAKALSTPGRLADGVIAAVERLGVGLDQVESFTHGTTAGLNAFLERRGARVALLTTQGFRDVYEIGRANRPVMYDVRYRPPRPLVPRRDVFEVPERLGYDGSVIAPVDEAAVRRLAEGLDGFDAVAVCLLHAHANPSHERRVAELIASVDPDVTVVCSHEVAPEWREYERTSTTVLCAYVAPVIATYLEQLERRLTERGLRTPLRVMQSNGGIVTAATARTRPLQTLFSGPVGGTTAGVAVGGDLDLRGGRRQRRPRGRRRPARRAALRRCRAGAGLLRPRRHRAHRHRRQPAARPAAVRRQAGRQPGARRRRGALGHAARRRPARPGPHRSGHRHCGGGGRRHGQRHPRDHRRPRHRPPRFRPAGLRRRRPAARRRPGRRAGARPDRGPGRPGRAVGLGDAPGRRPPRPGPGVLHAAGGAAPRDAGRRRRPARRAPASSSRRTA